MKDSFIKWIPNWKLFLIPIFAIFLFFSCQKEQVSSSDQIAPSQKSERLVDWMQQGKIRSIADLPAASLPAIQLKNSIATSRNANNKHLNSVVASIIKEQREHLEEVINPEDFNCGPTFLDGYINEQLKDLTEEEIDLLFQFGSAIPLLEAIYFDGVKDVDFFGYEGRFTSAIRFTFVKLKTFWDIPTDIQLSDMHGSVFQSVPLVAELLQMGFVLFDEEGNPIPIPDEVALGFAQQLHEVFSAEQFNNYNHPMFTFNAIAFRGIPELGLPKKIIMGDGIMEAYHELGLGSMAERLILAHEYGHHIHFSKDIFGDDTPESTRFIELLADTYASYFATHGRGLLMQSLFINRFIKTSFSIGDCAFDSPGHHGTPSQRAGAAALGGNLAKKQGIFHPERSSDEILQTFTEVFPELVAPDAE